MRHPLARLTFPARVVMAGLTIGLMAATALTAGPPAVPAPTIADAPSSPADQAPPPQLAPDPFQSAGPAVVAAEPLQEAPAQAQSADLSRIAATECGGLGERACCFLETDFGQCKDGLKPQNGCFDGEYCKCPGIGHSLATCMPVQSCGGQGQRACTFGERPFDPCDDGLEEVPGCSGDCYGDSFPSSTTCSKPRERIAEPELDAALLGPPPCPLYGYMDMHLHLHSDLASGGAVLAGRPYDRHGGVNAALKPDFGTFLALEDAGGNPQGGITCPSNIPNCGTTKLHADHFLDDAVGALGTGDTAGSNFGAPSFSGWPKWDSTTHQQSYHKWLERAWRGGLRLVTLLAVSNEALCRGNRRVANTSCIDSMKPIDAQLAEAVKFEEYINDLNDGNGWFKIVKSPEEARTAIAGGKLAVVLGIEVDNLFNCKFPIAQCTANTTLGEGVTPGLLDSCEFKPATNGRTGIHACTPESIDTQVDLYYNLGVRHVFPVHNFDNAFGGPATWQSGIDLGNRVVEDHWWMTKQCEDDYGFKIDLVTFGNVAAWVLRFLSIIPGAEFPAVNGSRFFHTADCNQLGMFPLGTHLIEKLMNKGMLIDIDHMSIEAIDMTLDQAEQRGYAGIVASHVLSYDLQDPSVRHERLRTRAQLERIRDLGGMIVAMLKDDGQDTDRRGLKETIPYGIVPDNCRHSAKTFAHAFQYAVDVMEGPVGLGSDFNGTAGHIGPRFGSQACGGEFRGELPFLRNDWSGRWLDRIIQAKEDKKLQYPFTLDGFGTFFRQQTGEKTFDFNYDGMAHIGLLPDFVAELRTVGLPENYISMLFRSAEAYVRVWEKASGEIPPVNSYSCATITGITAWPTPVYSHRNVYFSPTGTASVGGMTFSWAFGDGGTGSGPLPIHVYDAPGTYNVTATITDTLFGTSSSATTTITVLDGADSPDVKLTLGGPAEVFEGDKVPLRIGFQATPWIVNHTATNCGAGSRLIALVQTEILDLFTWRAEFEMQCQYLGGPQRTAEALVRVQHFLNAADFHTRTHQILVKNRPPVLVNTPSTISVPWGQPALLPVSARDAEGETVQFKAEWGPTTEHRTVVLTDQIPVVTFGHTFPAPSRAQTPYRVRVVVTDDDGAIAEKFVDVHVVGTPPLLTLSGTTRIGVGNVARYTITKQDPDGGTVTLTGFNCGEAGELLTPFATSVAFFDCKFNTPSPQNHVSVSAVDDEGATATKAVEVKIGTPPRGDLAGSFVAVEGGTAAITVSGLQTDGDDVTVTDFTCGGGTVVSFPPDMEPTGTLLLRILTCGFKDGAATETISVTLTDVDGSLTLTQPVTVNNVPPSLTLTPPGTILQGQPANVTLLFGDAGLDDVTVDINWGDGFSDTRSGGRQNPPLTLQHTWATAGPHTITAIATDSDGAPTTRTVNVFVVDTAPPVVTITAPTTVEATSPAGAPVTFTATATDNVDVTVTTTCSPASGSTFPLGTTTVTCTATDAAGNTGKASIVITVQDTTPPAMTCTVDPASLWPPNHRLIPVQAQVTVSDSASGAPGGFILRSVTSNEPDNGLGDGDTANDIQAFLIGTADTTGQLRAERSAGGRGRTYSLAFEARDLAGNLAVCTAVVAVPQNQGTTTGKQ